MSQQSFLATLNEFVTACRHAGSRLELAEISRPLLASYVADLQLLWVQSPWKMTAVGGCELRFQELWHWSGVSGLWRPLTGGEQRKFRRQILAGMAAQSADGQISLGDEVWSIWDHDAQSREGRSWVLLYQTPRQPLTPEGTLVLNTFASAVNRICGLERFQKQVHRDALTGLYNLRYLDVCLDREVGRSERSGQEFCVLFIDLNKFKQINDTHGHLLGNQVLLEVGGYLAQQLRGADMVFRYGGDEFVALLPETDLKEAQQVARRIEQGIRALRWYVSGKLAQISCAIGIGCYPEHGHNGTTLLAAADRHMYRAKPTAAEVVVENFDYDKGASNETSRSE